MRARPVILERDAEVVRQKAPTRGRAAATDSAAVVRDGHHPLAPLSASRLTGLQRQVGNHAVGSLMAARRDMAVQRVVTADDPDVIGPVVGAPTPAPSPVAGADAADFSLPGAVNADAAAPARGGAPPLPPRTHPRQLALRAPAPAAAPPVPARTSAGYLGARVRIQDARRPDAGVATGASSVDNDSERIGSTSSVASEVAKPALAAVGAGTGYAVGHGIANSSSALSGSTNAGGLAAGAFGGLSALDQGLGVYRGIARYRRDRGRDAAGAKLGLRKAKAQSLGMAAGIAGVAATAYKLRSSLGTLGTHAAGVAGGAAGIVGGGLMLGQGLHRTYQAIKKYRAAGSHTMYSARGKAWQDFIRTKQTRKGAAGAAKAVGGALGVAAGGLLLAGMAPAAFAVGIAAMAVGGVMALWKVGSKIKTAWNARKAAKEAQPAEMAAASQPNNHDKAKQLGDRLQRSHSEGGEKAAQMRDAYRAGKDLIPAAQGAAQTRDGRFVGADGAEVPVAALEAYDVLRLMAAINVSPELIESQSGQELIQKKLSLSEAM